MAEKLTLLIIEDDSTWATEYVNAIKQDIGEVTIASDLATAVEILKDRQFSLIILDLMLPDSQAANTIQTITSIAPYAPTVVVTSCENLAQQILIAGAQDYIIKNQFNKQTFIHAATLAIHRLFAKIFNETTKNINTVTDNFKSIETHLASIEADLNSILSSNAQGK